MRDVAAAAEEWKASAGRPLDDRGRRLVDLAVEVGAAMAALPTGSDDAAVRRVVATVRPVLGELWLEGPEGAAKVREAVGRLRAAAMHTPSLVAQCRRLRQAAYLTSTSPR